MPPTSLALYGESVVGRCPKTAYDVVAREDPERRFPAGCDAWYCEWCGPRVARRKLRVISWARPERFLTLTQAPEVWPALRQKVRTLKHELVKRGYSCEWAWCVERGPKTGMIHVHALQHGSYVPQAELQRLWGRIVHISAIHHGRGAETYALKGAADRYALKGATGAPDALTEHLNLNGGRGVHFSRGFLRGLTTDQVLELLRSREEQFTWVLVPAGQPLPAEFTHRSLTWKHLPGISVV